MSPHAITVILLLFCLGRQNAAPDPTSYVVSIVEYSPYSPDNIVDNVEQNLRAMQLLVEAAAKNGTQIVVFPEYGVIGFPYGSRSQLSEKLEQIPDNPSPVRESSPATIQVLVNYRSFRTSVVWHFHTTLFLLLTLEISSRAQHLPFSAHLMVSTSTTLT